MVSQPGLRSSSQKTPIYTATPHTAPDIMHIAEYIALHRHTRRGNIHADSQHTTAPLIGLQSRHRRTPCRHRRSPPHTSLPARSMTQHMAAHDLHRSHLEARSGRRRSPVTPDIPSRRTHASDTRIAQRSPSPLTLSLTVARFTPMTH
jgi:hypothetical protein